MIIRLLQILQNRGKLSFYRVPNGPVISGNKLRHTFRKNPSPGLPDIIILLPEGKTLWVEIKRPKTGRLSEHQRKFQATCRKHQHDYQVWVSLDDAINYLDSKGVDTTVNV